MMPGRAGPSRPSSAVMECTSLPRCHGAMVQWKEVPASHWTSFPECARHLSGPVCRWRCRRRGRCVDARRREPGPEWVRSGSGSAGTMLRWSMDGCVRGCEEWLPDYVTREQVRRGEPLVCPDRQPRRRADDTRSSHVPRFGFWGDVEKGRRDLGRSLVTLVCISATHDAGTHQVEAHGQSPGPVSRAVAVTHAIPRGHGLGRKTARHRSDRQLSRCGQEALRVGSRARSWCLRPGRPDRPTDDATLSFMTAHIVLPSTFEQLRTTSVGEPLRAIVQHLSAGCTHPAIVNALL